MFNIYKNKKLIASFVRLKDARSYVNSILFIDFSRKGFDIIAVISRRNCKSIEFTFGKKGIYHIVSISRVL